VLVGCGVFVAVAEGTDVAAGEIFVGSGATVDVGF